MIRDVTADDFAPYVGETCRVDVDGKAHDIVLESVVPTGHSPRDGGGFALNFRGPATSFMPQASYTITVGGAEHLIFLVPLGPDAEGMRYEAIFN